MYSLFIDETKKKKNICSPGLFFFSYQKLYNSVISFPQWHENNQLQMKTLSIREHTNTLTPHSHTQTIVTLHAKRSNKKTKQTKKNN